MLVNINTMSKKRLRPKNIPVVKSVYNSFAVLLQTLMKVIDTLCNMNMIANTVWFQFVTGCEPHLRGGRRHEPRAGVRR